ncbi:sigma-54 interaction domain-containing protein [Desulfitibacter alkalitolerans]|uniref:sigma-54 interaction domain-containing protein n=1 Tax=Desulfitibacter alkalitolerans TaxID=264641 RepID=UPI0006865B61|nr:sigma 54-interacting transcriptional regulator [Desulfitibacter alkalitolerans]
MTLVSCKSDRSEIHKFFQDPYYDIHLINNASELLAKTTSKKLLEAITNNSDWNLPFEVMCESSEHDAFNRNFLISVLEASSDGILISDSEAKVLYINNAYEETTGLTREKMLGKNLAQLCENGLFNTSASLMVLEKKRPVSLIHKYITGKNALTTACPVFSERGEIIGVINNTRDISSLIRLRNELIKTKHLVEINNAELKKLRRDLVADIDLIYESQKMKQIIDLLLKASRFDTSILIQGESGTGKEVLAKYIHNSSPRKDGPFIKVNCAAIPSELFESELFGYVSGSFTGATREGKPGLFELANHGTILLDEISELPIEAQSKLLRILQEREVLRVGATQATKLDIRIVAATNKQLKEEIKKGKFREDLFFRLNVFPITIPPLRDRKEDIPALMSYFIHKLNKEHNTIIVFDNEVIDIMINYSWPGNVRELQNLIEYLFIVNQEGYIGIEQLPEHFLAENIFADNTIVESKLALLMDIFEKKIITFSLKKHTSLRKAAVSLGIDPSTLSRKMKRLKIEHDYSQDVMD